MDSPAARSWIAIRRDSNRITGCSLLSGVSSGELPYNMMPGRTQLPWVCGQAIRAAEFARLTGASIPRMAWWKRASWSVVVVLVVSSALARCDIRTIFPTFGLASSRA